MLYNEVWPQLRFRLSRLARTLGGFGPLGELTPAPQANMSLSAAIPNLVAPSVLFLVGRAARDAQDAEGAGVHAERVVQGRQAAGALAQPAHQLAVPQRRAG
eukprot:844881-Pyramimonas_sp.AAC.2